MNVFNKEENEVKQKARRVVFATTIKKRATVQNDANVSSWNYIRRTGEMTRDGQEGSKTHAALKSTVEKAGCQGQGQAKVAFGRARKKVRFQHKEIHILQELSDEEIWAMCTSVKDITERARRYYAGEDSDDDD